MIDPARPDFSNTPVSPARASFSYAPVDPANVPSVSIVTPFYNPGQVFCETARSVLSQSLQQWEWLIVNDGSTDPVSLALLEEYRHNDPRIRVIDHGSNRGVSAARNIGFREARAECVVILDSDDLLEPTAIEKWFWFLQSYSQYSFVKGYSVGFGAQEYLWRNGFHNGDAFLDNNRVDPTAMIRRAVLEKTGGYDESNRDGLEDWDFWLRCASSGLWGATVPEYLNWYRRREAHTDRWTNWDRGERQASFRRELMSRYPLLWKGGFPRIQPPWHMPNEAVPDQLPCQNSLRRDSPRLLLIAPWLTMGGADRFNMNLIKQLQEQGWEATVATTVPGDTAWLPEFERLTPDVFVLPHFLRLVDYPRFLRYLVQSRNVDAVLISHSELAYLLLPYLRAHCPDVPILDFCHLEEEGWKNGGYPRMSIEYQESLDLTVVASEHLRQWMIERGRETEHIVVSHIGVDANKWRPDARSRADVRDELGLEADLPVILFAGRICAQKQPNVLAGALHHLDTQGARFAALVAGDGPDLESLRSLIKRLHLEPRVRLLGAVSQERLRELMAASDIFFLPSAHEGIALSIYEAMASGLAVIGADVGGQRELVTEGTGFLIRPGEPQVEALQYAEILSSLVNDPQHVRALGLAARKRIEAEFRIEQMGARMLDCIRSAKEAHERASGPVPSIGLARACATQAVEYTRLFQLADSLWNERKRSDVGASRVRPVTADTVNARASWRARLYLSLYKWHEPLYHWYTNRGWTWLTPLRDRAKRILLHPLGSSVDEGWVGSK